MKAKFLIPILFFYLSMMISSCSDGDIYKEYQELPGYKWERIDKGKSVMFDNIEIKNTDDSYDVHVMIRHTPFVNEDKIKFKMLITSPSGITRESVHTIALKDRSGKQWVGEALGDLIDIEEVCKKYISFPEEGLYTIELVNMGNKYETIGIMELGLRVIKSDLEIKDKE